MPAWRKILWSVMCSAGLLLLAVDEIFSAIEFSIGSLTQTNDEIEVEVTVKGLSSSSCFENRCYLQGLLTVENQNQYFGFTQNNQGNWYEYIGSPEVELIKSTFFSFEPKEGSWSGKLKVKNNSGDSDYKGPGNYSLQLRRYSGKSSSHAGESNALSVQLSYILPTPTPSPTPTIYTASPTPTSTPYPNATPQDQNASTQQPASTANPSPNDEEPIGKVAGFSFDADDQQQIATEEASFELLESSGSASLAGTIIDDEGDLTPKAKNWFPFIMGSVFLVSSVVSWALKRYNRDSLWEKIESSP